MTDDCRDLEALWRDGIPLANAMQLTIERGSADELVVAADLEPNINVHGTAFAGSLYAIAALAGWGLVWLGLRGAGVAGDIVLARGEIDYRRPVRSRIVCRAAWAPSEPQAFLRELAGSGRADVAVACTIGRADRAEARYTGRYVVHGETE